MVGLPFLIQYYVIKCLIKVLLILYVCCFIYFLNCCAFHSLYKARCVLIVFYVHNWSADYQTSGVSNIGVERVMWAILGVIFSSSTPLYQTSSECRRCQVGRARAAHRRRLWTEPTVLGQISLGDNWRSLYHLVLPPSSFMFVPPLWWCKTPAPNWLR